MKRWLKRHGYYWIVVAIGVVFIAFAWGTAINTYLRGEMVR